MRNRRRFILANRQTVHKRMQRILKRYRVGCLWADVSKCGYYVTPGCKEVDFYYLAEISKACKNGMRWEPLNG